MKSAAIVHPEVGKKIFARAIRPLLTQADVYSRAGVQLLAFEYPYLDLEIDWRLYGTKIRLRIDGTDYSYRPVGGWWIDSGGNPLHQGAGLVPSGFGFHVQMQSGEQRCWFCFAGWREYHDHISHQDLAWARLRGDGRYSVLQLVTQLQRDLNTQGVMRA
ncbi:hypothetical protein Q8F57_009890 [Paraburkholderia terrae]|uniref:hypothetical protein n=1 Tax=Paraburkholderia terrae TaxID=311230 RepID=UPI00296B4B68|nr:hypothetical protein [Paraburkholderia terrae]MDW3660434.1 hypothetical protein [Paraburkholderia terrae]